VHHSRLLHQRTGAVVVPSSRIALYEMHTYGRVGDEGVEIGADAPVPQEMLVLDIPRYLRPGGADAGLPEQNREASATLLDVPMYVKCQEVTSALDISNDCRTFHLKYCLLFAHNGVLTVCGCCGAGEHQHDLEHTTVEVCLPNADDSQSVVRRVFVSQHGGGRWYPWYNTEFADLDGKRPLLYSALHSHALHVHAGRHPRFCMAVWERYDGNGARWSPRPDSVILFDERTSPWLKYRGAMGFPTHGNMPAMHGWWVREREPDEDSGIVRLARWVKRKFFCA